MIPTSTEATQRPQRQNFVIWRHHPLPENHHRTCGDGEVDERYRKGGNYINLHNLNIFIYLFITMTKNPKPKKTVTSKKSPKTHLCKCCKTEQHEENSQTDKRRTCQDEERQAVFDSLIWPESEKELQETLEDMQTAIEENVAKVTTKQKEELRKQRQDMNMPFDSNYENNILAYSIFMDINMSFREQIEMIDSNIWKRETDAKRQRIRDRLFPIYFFGLPQNIQDMWMETKNYFN